MPLWSAPQECTARASGMPCLVGRWAGTTLQLFNTAMLRLRFTLLSKLIRQVKNILHWTPYKADATLRLPPRALLCDSHWSHFHGEERAGASLSRICQVPDTLKMSEGLGVMIDVTEIPHSGCTRGGIAIGADTRVSNAQMKNYPAALSGVKGNGFCDSHF